VVQVVEYQPSKHEVFLSSTPSTTKNDKLSRLQLKRLWFSETDHTRNALILKGL
jgi:hypothetical protein